MTCQVKYVVNNFVLPFTILAWICPTGAIQSSSKKSKPPWPTDRPTWGFGQEHSFCEATHRVLSTQPVCTLGINVLQLNIDFVYTPPPPPLFPGCQYLTSWQSTSHHTSGLYDSWLLSHTNCFGMKPITPATVATKKNLSHLAFSFASSFLKTGMKTWPSRELPELIF